MSANSARRSPIARALAIALLVATMSAPGVRAADLATAEVRAEGHTARYVADGVVAAVRQTPVSSPVGGAVTRLEVKAGDRVTTGKLLAVVDERVAQSQTAASEAQVAAANAQLAVAQREVERARQLFERSFISRSALDQAELTYQAALAEAQALKAQAQASRTQAGLYRLTAPYAGVVSKVDTELGDVAMPGKPLVTVYDPTALRISAQVPLSAVARLRRDGLASVEVPSANRSWEGLPVTVMPAADAAFQTIEVRIPLPADAGRLAPGAFARVQLPLDQADAAPRTRLMVPSSAIVRRSELTAVYVVDAEGRPQLRQVRLGRAYGADTEVLAGLTVGERVALNPDAATAATAASRR